MYCILDWPTDYVVAWRKSAWQTAILLEGDRTFGGSDSASRDEALAAGQRHAARHRRSAAARRAIAAGEIQPTAADHRDAEGAEFSPVGSSTPDRTLSPRSPCLGGEPHGLRDEPHDRKGAA
jgi:hypothetical protein